MTGPRLRRVLLTFGLGLLANTAWAATRPAAPRRVIDLDGTWQVEQGGMETPPARYGHTVPVPGLLDLAEPKFADMGKPSDRRMAFWYRRTFRIDGPVPDVALLKINKAKYGTKVWLNGQPVGEHLPCFTPGWFDVHTALRGEKHENELIVRVGAHRSLLPQDMPTGWDFEKYLYIPGIYDSVQLVLSGRPFIRNVQLVPDIQQSRVRVVVEIDCGAALGVPSVSAVVRPRGKTKAAGSAQAEAVRDAGGLARADFFVPIADCRLWSPEDPFLYVAAVSTGSDAVAVRFGMRTFRFDPATKRAILNGKTYYLRGSNVTAYRFFEDAARGALPWQADWVRRLHRQFKSMHWNALRYCIGFPPELWYDIADEEGMLIQDEFPIWLLGGPRSKCPEWPLAEKIVPQYTEWMRERWNHPCVVIWDGQNESHTPETGNAIQAVRHLDLSGRAWENGWAEPQADTDCVESHPYLFIRGWSPGKPFEMREVAGLTGDPRLNKAQRNCDVAVLMNEYGWLWLTRDGQPTCLTQKIYEHLLGPEATVAQRRRLYARYLAALTEFWRAHRRCAGVLHFCGLGYSRPGDWPRPEGGATSDHWQDLQRLEFEPLFAEYVREAFNPVGLMLDLWDDQLPASQKRDLRVYVINDRNQPWHGDVRLVLIGSDGRRLLQSQQAEVAPLGRTALTFAVTLPDRSGRYTLQAELDDPPGTPIRSRREFQAK